MTDESGTTVQTATGPELAQDLSGTGSFAPASGTALSSEEIGRLTDEIVAALKSVYDPEIPADVYELGLIYKIDIGDDRAELSRSIAALLDDHRRQFQSRDTLRHPSPRRREETDPHATRRRAPDAVHLPEVEDVHQA